MHPVTFAEKVGYVVFLAGFIGMGVSGVLMLYGLATYYWGPR